MVNFVGSWRLFRLGWWPYWSLERRQARVATLQRRTNCRTDLTEGDPLSCYLRFTPSEYEAICRVVQCIKLSDDFLPVFKYFLVESLIEIHPDLAGRLALLRGNKIKLLYRHLRERKRSKTERSQ
jgi:hypothetical protein